MRSMILVAWLPVLLLLSACAGVRSPGPGTPQGQGGMVRGQVFVNETDLLLLESFPVQVMLRVEGELPTPCHELVSEVEEPDASGRIEVSLYSEAPADEACIQVLQPFEERIRIGSFESGSYTVFVNGEQVGEFEL